MTSTRQLKFARLIQKELADIFQKDQKSLFKNNIVSVTHVMVSPDLSVAKVYLSLVIDKNKQEDFENIEHHKGEIRHTLAKRIGKQVRKIPELIFYLDQGAEHAENIDNIFKNLDIPPKDDE